MFYNGIMQQHLAAVEEALPNWLPKEYVHHKPVGEAMAYACAAGGKRLRPVLLMEFCRICGGDVQKAIPFACALEMIHSYSLVHDDLPCMDNSPMRRGKPSVHAAYGETMALLTGDALLNRAFEVVLSPEARAGVDPTSAASAAFELANAAGLYGMIGGQVMDLRAENESIDLNTLKLLQEGKTAALFRAACRMGALLGGASEEQLNAADKFAYELGLCFQIVDDILDEISTPEDLGKPVGSDVENGKTTYVTLLGVTGAEKLAKERTAEAIEALVPFGAEADGLRGMTRALLVRTK